MASAGVGDTVYFGPEAEFFIFDDVRFDTQMNKAFYYIDSTKAPTTPARNMRAAISATAPA
ncbi:MAG: hypothetical protein WDM89_21055 [Rhizomicrobium sp.]